MRRHKSVADLRGERNKGRSRAQMLLNLGDWPVWDDREIEHERWHVAEGSGRSKEARSKTPNAPAPSFDDGCTDWLPPSIKGRAREWVRVGDAINAIKARANVANGGSPLRRADRVSLEVVSAARFERRVQLPFATEAEEAFMRMKGISPRVRIKEPEVSLFLGNEHIYSCETWRFLMSLLDILQHEPNPSHDAHTFRPWSLVYPQENGMPVVNPTGKYCVKLFLMGAWRKVTIDDKFPVDEDGNLLVPRSSTLGELWPLLVIKAVARMLATTYETRVGILEFGEASLVQILTGWVAETVPLDSDKDNTDLLSIFRQFCKVPADLAVDKRDVHAAAMTKLGSLTAPSRTSEPTCGSPSSRSGPASPRSMSKSPVNHPPSARPHSASSGHTSVTENSSRPERTRRVGINLEHLDDETVSYKDLSLSARIGLRNESDFDKGDQKTAYAAASSLHEPEDERVINSNVMIIAFYRNNVSYANLDVNLPGLKNHLFRVLSCVHYPTMLATGRDAMPKTFTPDEWVLELESPLLLYTGPLGHQNMNIPNASRIQMALGVSFEREQLLQDEGLELRRAGLVAPPFRFRMLFSDFLKHFSDVKICYKMCNFIHRTTVVGGVGSPTPEVLEMTADVVSEHADKKPHAPDANGIDMSSGQPWLLYVNATSPTDMLISFAITPDTSLRNVRDDGDHGDPRHWQEGTLILEEFNWKSMQAGKTYLHLTTTGMRSFRFGLQPGRHIMRVIVMCPKAYTLTILSNKEYALDDEVTVLRQLGGCSARFMVHVRVIVRAVNVLLNKTPEENIRNMRHLAFAHFEFNVPSSALSKFWTCALPALREVLKTVWGNTVDTDRGPLTVGRAWEMLILELHAATVRAFEAGRHVLARRARMGSKAATSATQRPLRSLPFRQAAIIIQKHVRGYLARCEAESLRFQRGMVCRAVAMKSWETVMGDIDCFCNAVVRHLAVEAPEVISMLPFASDEQNRCVVKNFYGRTIGTPAHEYVVLFQEHLIVARPTQLYARLHVPAAGADGEAPTVFQLHIINNETGDRISSTSANGTVTSELAPTGRGYTLMADGFTHCMLPAFAWGLRLLSSIDLPPFERAATLPLRTLSSSHSTLSADFHTFQAEGACGEVARGDEIFRYIVSPASLRQQCTLVVMLRPTLDCAPIDFTLRVLRDGDEIASVSGRGKLVMPLVDLNSDLGAEEVDPAEAESAYSLFQVVCTRKDGRGLDAELPLSPRVDDPDERRGPRKSGSSRAKRSFFSVAEPRWLFRVLSKEPLDCTIDRIREEEITAIKAAWFAAAPGRRTRGKGLLKKFYSNTLPPISAPSGSASPNLSAMRKLPIIGVAHPTSPPSYPGSPPLPATPASTPSSRSPLPPRRARALSDLPPARSTLLGSNRSSGAASDPSSPLFSPMVPRASIFGSAYGSLENLGPYSPSGSLVPGPLGLDELRSQRRAYRSSSIVTCDLLAMVHADRVKEKKRLEQEKKSLMTTLASAATGSSPSLAEKECQG
eukprot:m.77303 g.77303  ORF g.77303 m.77303 type:complete len:1503 (+) comp7912_c0_seq2:72-4580(+)